MDTEGIELDPRVERLVKVMNDIPGVYTFSSCGGHEAPAKDQVPRDQFNIGFDLEWTSHGFRALSLIQFAIQKTSAGLGGNMKVTTWADPGDVYNPGALHFELNGQLFADPNELADTLTALLREYGGRP